MSQIQFDLITPLNFEQKLSVGDSVELPAAFKAERETFQLGGKW